MEGTSHSDSLLSHNGTIITRIQGNRVRPNSTNTLPTFYQNLEDALDIRRASHSFYSVVQNNWQNSDAVDFCSGDILSLGKSPDRRAEFLKEFDRHPDFSIGSSGVRLMDGNHTYLEQTEQEIADFHGAQTGLIVGSAYEANIAVWTSIPRPGDVILYDSLVHASTHEGIKQSLAMSHVEFPHSDIESFRSTLLEILDSQSLVRQGKRSVIVAVESIYSMDGDVCPLEELLEVAREVLPDGNIQFIVDEAHSVGVIGPMGSGLVCKLGLQKDIAVVVHSFGKALGATGAIILGNQTVKSTIINFSRSVMYTTSPSFPFVAAIKSGYTLLKSGCMSEAQDHIQRLCVLFFETLENHPLWPLARERELLSVPLARGWEDRPFQTHIITVSTHQNYTYWLFFHLLSQSLCVFPVEHPVVPRTSNFWYMRFSCG
ncbi:5-aminolevulinate synthase [Xylaria bambusicola]|uniref:5-aminolevulinate synthase n=1 Tax=Xylaria bambusicola TaxID=326684 RepID=UPI0020076DEE|nr:5-aminolevulinate synthase [Xylaria bambusicola]KAI0509383.1 5-aminolevulinate synthase [Xylaria bambusicola]